jgi:CheY-like chemotaxis protein
MPAVILLSPEAGVIRMKSWPIKKRRRQLAKPPLQINRFLSRFLAASHGLRQPLHALGLFVAQLRSTASEVESKRLIEQIDTAVSILNEQFRRLLNLSDVGATASRPSRGNKATYPSASTRASLDRTYGKLIVVIDDDPLVLDSTGGLLRSWGCAVVTSSSGSGALAGLIQEARPPDLTISDFRLSDGKTGVETIAGLRSAFPRPIPAFLISGDTSRGALQEARTGGFHLLYKPVDPMRLRAMLNRMLITK